jgi:hypothetical protein
MILLPNHLAVVINRINDSIINNYKEASNLLLLCFLANGRAYYDNLFMLVIIYEVKAKREREK